MYNTLLKRFPFIEVTSMEFMGSVGMLVLSHVVWMRQLKEAYHSVEYLLGFFLMVVWLVPFGFFISLAANESTLPGSGLAGSGGGLGGMGAGGGGGMGGMVGRCTLTPPDPGFAQLTPRLLSTLETK